MIARIEEALAAIEALPWVSDGIAGNEGWVVDYLRSIAHSSPDFLEQLMLRPWLAGTGDDPHHEEGLIIRYLSNIAAQDTDIALAVAQLGILDTVELGDSGLVKYFLNLLTSDPEGLRQLLDHPGLSADAGDTEERLIPLLYLESKDPESAGVIEALPWVQDGMEGFEIWSVMHLTDLALVSQQVFHALLGRELDWMPPNPNVWIHTQALEHLVTIGATDEAAAMQVIDLPFLESLSIDGYEALKLLADLARSDPAYLQEILSDPALLGGSEEDFGIVLSLIDLRRNDPEAADAIEGLEWYRDGIGRPAYDNVSLANPDPAEFEQFMLLRLIDWAERSREVFMALVSKPWLQDSLTMFEQEVFGRILDLAAWRESQALRVLDMPFLDTIERDDDWMLEIMWELRWDDPEALQALLDQPELEDGIQDGMVWVLNGLRLELRDSEAAAAIDSLPWVRDGISVSESDGILAMQFAALRSNRVYWTLMDKPWVKDGLSEDETSTIELLIAMSSQNGSCRAEAEALQLLGMPFLESVDGVDAAAVNSLFVLCIEGDGTYLQSALTHPALKDGITDDKAVVVSVLSMVVRDRPELIDVLLNPGLTTAKKRVISLPLKGDVALAVVSVEPGTSEALDLLERIVSMEEDLMGVAFPKRYAAMLIADATGFGGGGGPSGIITVDPGRGGDVGLIAHEAAHIYWAQSPEWLREGAAEAIRVLVESSLSGFAAGRYQASCSIADNLGDLDRLAIELIASDPAGASDTIYRSGCMYSLGLGLFMDLYHQLGPQAFRQGFGSLYVKLKAEEHGACAGLERGVCYVRAAFVGDAMPQAAAIAAPIIDKWYNGNPMNRP